MDWLKECAEVVGWICLGGLLLSGLFFWLCVIFSIFISGDRICDAAPRREPKTEVE